LASDVNEIDVCAIRCDGGAKIGVRHLSGSCAGLELITSNQAIDDVALRE
jgi:hypothetical protein